jgi:predicted nucleotidyltransferase
MAYIRKVCKRIAEAYHPEKIILFGSHAYGNPTPESDMDLLIVMDCEDHPIDQTVRMRIELGLVTPMDLLVRTPEEVKKRVEEGDMFMRLIVERGKVMYEAKHDGVDRKS